MYRDELRDDEDLRVEIFHLKKQLSNINAENQLLKVKIRKLQNEIVKKDKQMDVVLDPRKSPDVRKILYERSASFVLNMKEKNDELLYLLQEKDVIIRRLQNQLDVAKLYSQTPKKYYHCKCSESGDLTDNKKVHLKVPSFRNGTFGSPKDNGKVKKKSRSLSWTPELQEEPTLMEDVIAEENSEKKDHSSSYDIKEQYKSLSREHLLSIIENLKNNQRSSPTSRQTSSRKSSPESDLDRIELLCESPHEEIQQLHLHFLDMISEVDHLKNTIAQLQNNQEMTENVLKKKDTNIDRLAQEIKNLKRPKPKPRSGRHRRPYSSTDLVARVYSSNQNQVCSRFEKEKRNRGEKTKENVNKKKKNEFSGKSTMKDAVVQVDESPEVTSRCVYVEKGSITITQKTATSQTSVDKEYNYEDEVFEECDEESTKSN